MKFLVLGGGAQGSAAAFDLLRDPAVSGVTIADRETGSPPPFLLPFLASGKLVLRALDASDEGAVEAAMRGHVAALCALPYYFNLPATRAAIRAGVHFCDLGGNTAIVRDQLALAEEANRAGVSIVPDCGLAPGMVNILAQAGIDALDRTDSVMMYVGGLPQKPVPPINYQIVYSMEGVIDYYTSTSVILREGHRAEAEALSEVEPVEFGPGVGTLEAFHTAGGVSTLPDRYAGRIRRMEYKTLRFPGHAEIMRGIRALGLFDTDPIPVDGCEVSPRDFFIRCASPRLRNPEGEDMVVLRVEATGERNGAPAGVRFDLVDRYDAEHGITAMMRTTGYSLSITARMQADGRIGLRGSDTPDGAVPARAYLDELARRGIRIERSEIG